MVELGFRGAPGCLWGTWTYIGGSSSLVELQGAHEGGGHAKGVGAHPCLVASSKLPGLQLHVSWIAFVSKRSLPKVSFRLDSV